jgi:hypothetical protein
VAAEGFKLAAKGTNFVPAQPSKQSFNDVFKTGKTVAAPTAAAVTNAFAAATQIVQTKPIPVAVNTATPPTPSYNPIRETVCQIRQKDLLARL